jgi:hypothetical protein
MTYWGSAKMEADKRKARVKAAERDWEKRRYGKSPEDIERLTEQQKKAEANWRKRRRETGTSGEQITL